jgi:hypothetical protein
VCAPNAAEETMVRMRRMLWLMTSGKLPAYLIEQDDEGSSE